MAEAAIIQMIPRIHAEVAQLRAYKGIYALCTVKQKKGTKRELKATHWAVLLTGGPTPTWGVWTVSGKYVRMFTYKHEIEAAYTKLVWRRHMATWQCVDTEHKSIETRRSELEKMS